MSRVFCLRVISLTTSGAQRGARVKPKGCVTPGDFKSIAGELSENHGEFLTLAGEPSENHGEFLIIITDTIHGVSQRTSPIRGH